MSSSQSPAGVDHTTAEGSARSRLENEVVVSLARLLTQHMAEMGDLTSAHGLSLVHHNVLRILRGAGSDGLPRGTIAERLITREPDVTRLLDRMEKQQLIVRTRDQTDRRVVNTHITERGLQILSALDVPLQDLLHRTFGHVPTERLQALIDSVHQISGSSR